MRGISVRRRLIRIACILVFFPPLVSAVGGWLAGPAFLHPIRRTLSPELVREARLRFARLGTQPEDFEVRAPDGSVLRGWKVRPQHPNGSWVLVFHGVADNRMGVVGHAAVLLEAGYSVVLMDARAHGSSEGRMATYGWLERDDTRRILDRLMESEAAGPPLHVFALGESMGAGIALESAAADPRIEGVVAEASFANLTEAAYDYAGLRRAPWLGRTLLAPGAWMLVYRGGRVAGFPASGVAPEESVARRAFPVLLICDEEDHALPCRHSERIYAAAIGPKELWRVPHAFHTAALGLAPAEFRTRVVSFYDHLRTAPRQPEGGAQGQAGLAGKSAVN